MSGYDGVLLNHQNTTRPANRSLGPHHMLVYHNVLDNQQGCLLFQQLFHAGARTKSATSFDDPDDSA